jgi:hypothetical protein
MTTHVKPTKPEPESGGDHPPQAAYEAWLAFNPGQPTWADLTSDVQAEWNLIAQAAIDAD